MLADEVDFVIGVDPHRDAHAVSVVDARSGGVVEAVEAAANVRGYQEALDLVERCAPGRRAWAIEGTGSYGAGLTRFFEMYRASTQGAVMAPPPTPKGK